MSGPRRDGTSVPPDTARAPPVSYAQPSVATRDTMIKNIAKQHVDPAVRVGNHQGRLCRTERKDERHRRVDPKKKLTYAATRTMYRATAGLMRDS